MASLSCVPVLQLSELKQRLGEAEAERDKLLEELRGGHGVETSDSDDLEGMFDFPGIALCTCPHQTPRGHADIPVSHVRKIAHSVFLFSNVASVEKLLSKRSKAAQDEATCRGDPESADASPEPVEPGAVAELRKQIEELTSQNSELALKVKVRRVRIHRLTNLITPP